MTEREFLLRLNDLVQERLLELDAESEKEETEHFEDKKARAVKLAQQLISEDRAERVIAALDAAGCERVSTVTPETIDTLMEVLNA